MWCKDEQHCPYAEESQPIHVDVHVSSKHFLMQTYSSRFFLSDIGGRFLGPGVFFLRFSSRPRWPCCRFTVKPDKVIIRKVNATTVAWSYPSSWNTPFSYFPLTFQIRQLRKSCRTCDHPCTQTRVTKVGLTALERLNRWQRVIRIWGTLDKGRRTELRSCFSSQTLTVSSPEIYQHQVKRRIKVVCVRAKDALCISRWGEWSFLRSLVLFDDIYFH